MVQKNLNEGKKDSFWALLPIAVFVLIYLGLGGYYEFIEKIPMAFYKIPILFIFLIALAVAFLQNKKLSFDEKLKISAKGIGDKNIFIMILIFMLAGIFVGVVGRSSAESVAYFLLSVIPVKFVGVVIFVVSAFVSLAMGTSVGTITLITPVAISVASSSGILVPLCIGSVIGGAMFGDNLSFISDTTIAACSGQGCKMQDKFKENFAIALPAALISIVIIFFLTKLESDTQLVLGEYSLPKMFPYILVLVGGIMGINVFVILVLGILAGAVISFIMKQSTCLDLIVNIGNGVSGMLETAMVAILVAAICAQIAENGGFSAMMRFFSNLVTGHRLGQLCIGFWVGFLDIATANNTVAIVMANPIAKKMAETYEISPKKTASLLDTFSCIFQGIIPYGAQMLVAIAVAADMNCEISAFKIMPNLVYPYMLFLTLIIAIIRSKKKLQNA